ncbi:hypothetical protein KI387_010779, partial [Taxus chinensis]
FHLNLFKFLGTPPSCTITSIGPRSSIGSSPLDRRSIVDLDSILLCKHDEINNAHRFYSFVTAHKCYDRPMLHDGTT